MPGRICSGAAPLWIPDATSERCPIEWTQDNNLNGARGDEELLRHIISNLLSNAVKYSAEQSPVKFSARRDGDDAVIQITDRGMGIPDEAMPQLFTAFYRGSNVSGRPGTGAWRSRREFFGGKFATMWLRKDVELTPEIQAQILRATDLCNELLHGWIDSFPSLYFFFPFQGSVGFDPRIMNWVQRTPADREINYYPGVADANPPTVRRA